MSQFNVITEIVNERERQDLEWGEQNHPDGTGADFREYAEIARRATNQADADGALTWLDILTEEFAEVAAADDEEGLRDELVQTAAVALAWVEAIDRRRARRMAA